MGSKGRKVHFRVGILENDIADFVCMVMISLMIAKSLFVFFADWPNGLCIDYESRRLYWADAQLDRIETSDLQGNNRVQLVTQVPHVFGLALVSTCISRYSGPLLM